MNEIVTMVKIGMDSRDQLFTTRLENARKLMSEFEVIRVKIGYQQKFGWKCSETIDTARR